MNSIITPHVGNLNPSRAYFFLPLMKSHQISVPAHRILHMSFHPPSSLAVSVLHPLPWQDSHHHHIIDSVIVFSLILSSHFEYLCSLSSSQSMLFYNNIYLSLKNTIEYEASKYFYDYRLPYNKCDMQIYPPQQIGVASDDDRKNESKDEKVIIIIISAVVFLLKTTPKTELEEEKIGTGWICCVYDDANNFSPTFGTMCIH